MIGRLLARNLAQTTANILKNESATTVLAKRNYISQISIPSVQCIRGIHVGHSCLVKVQHPAPAFKGTAVVDGDFKEIDICDFRGQYLVLFFYPLDFTFVCPTEIIAFSDRIKDFKAINTAVVGVSCDSHFSHLAWINTPRKHGGLGELKYPLLADFNKTIARDYNVLLEDDGVPLRGLFIIDPQGTVRQITVNDLPVGRSVDEVLRLVKAFQFTDKHGEVVCVSSPDQKGSREFKSKFSVPNIKPKSSYTKKDQLPLGEETEETRGLSVAQLERVVLLDQLKYYRMQLEEMQSKRDEIKKQEKTTVSLLQERDCIAV
uniref:thioredoxin-dependent peroxiredoxin n=1 Tax=Cuerna arida TaxID=1464854 RepID=A0A1B6FW33_9HEMI